MNTTPTQQPAPDHGEPWHEQTASINQGVHWLNTEQFNRAVACVNACAGIADPAAEIQAMRIAAQDLVEAIQNHDYFKDRHNYVGGDLYINKALANLKPFLKP